MNGASFSNKNKLISNLPTIKIKEKQMFEEIIFIRVRIDIWQYMYAYT